VVGDDAQSIYSFRAATVENILGFPRAVRPPARHHARGELPLDPAVLDAANALIAEGRGSTARSCARRGTGAEAALRDGGRRRGAGALRGRAGARGARARRAAAAPGGALSQPRTTADVLELELVRRNIPYVKYGGLKFLEAAHVKDLLAVLRWADNPRTASRRSARCS
jgi:DNA helicase II / ATP-dependent DNA helicase PcrA